MADIKGLSIFNNTNNGMKAIKEAQKTKDSSVPFPPLTEEKSELKDRRVTVPKERTKIRAKRSVGAPIKNYDRTHASKQPIKLSTILNSTSRSMVEKYETSLNKDELLRKALDFYIKQNLTKEDKFDLLRDVTRDLEIFREKNPTIEMVDEEGNVIKSAKQIENETEHDLRKRWGIDN